MELISEDYIAYVFAKDTPYVKCGTYAGTGGVGNNSQCRI